MTDEKHPIDDSLKEIEKILKMLGGLKGKDLTLPEYDAINRQIDEVYEQVETLSHETDELLKESGMTDARLKEALELIPTDIPLGDQEALKKAQKLKAETLKLKEEIIGSAEFEQQGKKGEKKKDKILSKEEHKKKYKRLGSKKKWKPL